jgi:hypothetical protein
VCEHLGQGQTREADHLIGPMRCLHMVKVSSRCVTTRPMILMCTTSLGSKVVSVSAKAWCVFLFFIVR